MSYPDTLVTAVHALRREGESPQRIADLLGLTRAKVRRVLAAHPVDVPPRNEAMDALTSRREKVTDRTRDVECRVDRMVTTVDEAAAAAGIDLTVWRVVSLETRHYPIQTKGGARQGTYIKLRCDPVDGLSELAQMEALVDGVLAARCHTPILAPDAPQETTERGALGLLVINDPHFAKLCWAGSTNEANWNLGIARDTVLGASQFLLRRLPPVERIVVALLGDIFHYDTLAGTTTGGTTMDRDSRVAKMLETGAETITSVIRHAAMIAPVTVIGVPGNHDAVLTLALQRILVAEFRADDWVTIDEAYTRRKVFAWGKTLLQFDHGDKAKKKLALMLPQEHPALWGQSVYREIHTGHLHTAHETDVAFTEQGVIVRTHEALCPNDQWHYDEGYTGSGRSQSAFVYRAEGALEQIIRFDPRVHLPRQEAA